jgi:hypothetical protein
MASKSACVFITFKKRFDEFGVLFIPSRPERDGEGFRAICPKTRELKMQIASTIEPVRKKFFISDLDAINQSKFQALS